jgi:hypothetical protein
MKAAPIFVVGSPRSGTSILTWSLGQHPNILPVEESNWLSKFALELASSYTLGAGRGERSSLSAMGITCGQFFEHFGRAIDLLLLGNIDRFMELSALSGMRDPRQVKAGFKLLRSNRDRKTRWVDGTPEYSFAVIGLRKLFPKAKFIHVVRDVHAVVRSMMTFDVISDRPLVRSEQEAYDYWYRAVTACHAAEQALGSRQMLRVRHADLVSQPELTIRRCLQFVGEGFNAACLEPLKTRINSSGALQDYRLGSGAPDPALVANAAALSAELLADPTPDYRANRRRREALEQQFAGQAAFVASLDSERLKLLCELRRVEHELETLGQWARVQQVREAVRTHIPLGATVIVTAPPEDPLLQLDGREVWGFPRDWNTPDGPLGGASLVEEFKELCLHDDRYLVITHAARSLMRELLSRELLQAWEIIWSEEACDICAPTCGLRRAPAKGEAVAGAGEAQMGARAALAVGPSSDVGSDPPKPER